MLLLFLGWTAEFCLDVVLDDGGDEDERIQNGMGRLWREWWEKVVI